ncbi:MAG: tRNA pseudouridine(38-40) synthase TruA [Chloroflexi bacterium RBG_16_48_8]|nr:MAG: tRNA pseudouridine(38-40) synthase TruA [Chloroflexi bacterium RBG_16_48_8]
METYKSIIAYDGTDFKGFQRQAEVLRTIQGEFEGGLKRIGWKEESIKAAGRTDAGVHARGQVVSYVLDWRSQEINLTKALNANLPADIAVRDTEKAPAHFHPRYSARSRFYRYAILFAKNRDPLRERYSWRIWPIPSFETMTEITDWIIGRHDFGAFGNALAEGGHTVREVYRARWIQTMDGMIFEIEANAFLYRMVRRLVAAMLEVGRQPDRKEEFRELIRDSSRRWEGRIAPASGLCLEMVTY